MRLATPVTGGVRIEVRLTPRANRDEVDGAMTLLDGRTALACRVRAAPDAGHANKALIALLSEALAVPQSAIRLERGTTRRQKTLRIAGDPDALVARLERL